jgi:hypothetical protein
MIYNLLKRKRFLAAGGHGAKATLGNQKGRRENSASAQRVEGRTDAQLKPGSAFRPDEGQPRNLLRYRPRLSAAGS